MKNVSTHPAAGYQSPMGFTRSRVPRARRPHPALLLPAAAALLLGAAVAGATQPDEGPVVALEIEYPADASVLGPGSCGVLVAGRAGAPQLDLVIALDTSVSTADASGVDVDGDGQVGRSGFGRVGFTMGEVSSDPGDSVLAAEVEAARRLVRRLDFRRTRAALVTFSGGPADLEREAPVLPDAITRVPLSADPTLIEDGLDALLRETPAGGTHMGAGIDRATVELLGLAGARSRADPKRARATLVMSDGAPTLPYGPERPADNVQSTLNAADRARKARVRVSTVAFGRDALERPVAAVEIAERTGGRFVPIRDTATLLATMAEADLIAGVEVGLRNETSGATARAFRMTPDGSFGGFVPLVEGTNRIVAEAHGPDGAAGRAELRVTMKPQAEAGAVPQEYDFLANDVEAGSAGGSAFGACLRQAPRIDLTAEDLRREELRRQLRLELERERARALERADEQRKELELEPAAP
jgi:hypothetical protein